MSNARQQQPRPTPSIPNEAPEPTPAEVPWVDPYDVSYRRDWIFLALLLIATAAAFLPALQAQFIWGDDRAITGNEALRSIHTLTFAWLHPHARDVYRPLADTFLFPQFAIWRSWNPQGYHTISLALHLINTWLVWLGVRRLKLPGALLAACLFAVHPVAAQPVAWLSQQAALLATLFSLLSLLAYLRLTEIDPPPPEAEGGWNLSHRKPLLVALTTLLLAAALLCDAPIACGTPIVMALILWWKNEGVIIRRNIVRLVPPAIVGIVITAIVAWAQWTQSPSGSAAFFAAGHAILWHALKLAIPYPLGFETDRWADATISVVFLAIVIVAIGMLWSMRNRIGRGAFTAIAGYLALLLPAVVVADPRQDGPVSIAQQYFARTTLIALLAAGLARLFAEPADGAPAWRHAARRGAFLLLLVALGTLTWSQAEVYLDTETLWTHVLKHRPASTLARAELGKMQLARDHLPDAEDQFTKLLTLDPNNAEAHADLAAVYQKQKKEADALAHLREAARLRPTDGSIYRRLASAASQAGDTDAAIANYHTALEIDPRDDIAMNNLATVYARLGKNDDAIAEYNRAIETNPHSTSAHLNLANLLFAQGNFDAAAEHLQAAVKIDPSNFDAYMTAGGMLLNFKRFNDAARMFREAIHLRNDSPRAYNAYGVSLAALGQYGDAIINFGRALDLDPNYVAAKNNLDSARRQRDGGNVPSTTTAPSPS